MRAIGSIGCKIAPAMLCYDRISTDHNCYKAGRVETFCSAAGRSLPTWSASCQLINIL